MLACSNGYQDIVKVILGHLDRFLLITLLRTLFEKSNFCPKIQFYQNPNILTSFSPKFFLTKNFKIPISRRFEIFIKTSHLKLVWTPCIGIQHGQNRQFFDSSYQ